MSCKCYLVGKEWQVTPYSPVSNPYITCLEDYRLVIGGTWPKTDAYRPYFFAAAKHEDVDFDMKNREDTSYYAIMAGSFDLAFNESLGLQSILMQDPKNGVFYAHGGRKSINDYITQWANNGGGSIANGINVSAGSVIGTVGTSGSSAAPHLHFGRIGGGTMIGNTSDALYKADRFPVDPSATYTGPL